MLVFLLLLAFVSFNKSFSLDEANVLAIDDDGECLGNVGYGLYFCWGAFIYGLMFRSRLSTDDSSKWKIAYINLLVYMIDANIQRYYQLPFQIRTCTQNHTLTWDLIYIIIWAMSCSGCSRPKCKWVTWSPIPWRVCKFWFVIIHRNVVPVCVSECVTQSSSGFLKINNYSPC